MREFQERRKLRKIFYSWPFVFLLVAMAGILLISTIKVYKKNKEAKLLNNEIKKELYDLEKRKSDLESSISKLETESGVEEEMRKKLNIRKPGEKTLVIIDENIGNDKINSEDNGGTGFFEKIWQWIKGIF